VIKDSYKFHSLSAELGEKVVYVTRQSSV